MRTKILAAATFVTAFSGLAPAFAAETNMPPAAKPASPPVMVEDIANLPGNGPRQHDFIYTGEFDTRKKVATISLVQGGKVTKTYQIPTTDPSNGQLSEFSDLHRLSNGDIVYAYKTGWRKVDADGNVIYDFKCPSDIGPDGKSYWKECHSAQPFGTNRVLFMLNGHPAKLCLFNIREGRMEMEHVMQTKSETGSVHGEFRNVRMTKAGTYLIGHMDLNRVIEYDRDWHTIWETTNAPSVWHAVRLSNGNTLVSGNQHAFARELNPKGEIVWEFGNDDLKGTGIVLYGVHQAVRLQNGNTVLCNWCPGRLGKQKSDWPKTVQVIEVTPDKKVVWALREWTNPDLGTASCIQMLDEPGADEDQDLMR